MGDFHYKRVPTVPLEPSDELTSPTVLLFAASGSSRQCSPVYLLSSALAEFPRLSLSRDIAGLMGQPADERYVVKWTVVSIDSMHHYSQMSRKSFLLFFLDFRPKL
jgi:hypothetical protein